MRAGLVERVDAVAVALRSAADRLDGRIEEVCASDRGDDVEAVAESREYDRLLNVEDRFIIITPYKH